MVSNHSCSWGMPDSGKNQGCGGTRIRNMNYYICLCRVKFCKFPSRRYAYRELTDRKDVTVRPRKINVLEYTHRFFAFLKRKEWFYSFWCYFYQFSRLYVSDIFRIYDIKRACFTRYNICVSSLASESGLNPFGSRTAYKTFLFITRRAYAPFICFNAVMSASLNSASFDLAIRWMTTSGVNWSLEYAAFIYEFSVKFRCIDKISVVSYNYPAQRRDSALRGCAFLR